MFLKEQARGREMGGALWGGWLCRMGCVVLLSLGAVGCRESETAKWSKQLSSVDAKEREVAALELGKLGPVAEDSVPALIGALADKEPRVVSASVRALRAVGNGAWPARPALAGLYKKTTDNALKKEIEQTLKALPMGPQRKVQPLRPLAELVAILEQEKDPKKLAPALVQIGRHRENAAAYAQKMVDALDHASADVRQAASAGITLLGPKVALPVLEKNLEHKSLRLRNNAIRTIGLFGPNAISSLDVLLKHAQSKEPKLRRASLWSIGALGQKSREKALPLVTNALKDPEWLVRGAACFAYGHLTRGSPEAFPVLLSMFKDAHPHVRYTALELILRYGAKAQVVLAQALKDQEPEVRALALQGGSGLRLFGAEMLPSLVAATQDKAWQVRLAAVMALGSFGTDARSALPTLQKMMSDSDIRVRRAVLQSFLSIQKAKTGAPRPTPPRPPVLPLLKPSSMPASSPAARP